MGNLINKKELTNFEISILYKEMPENYKIRLINPFLSTENNMVKINARVKDSYEINRNQLIFEIKKYIESEFNNVDTFEINGLLVLYNNMLQSLFDSQLKSFGIIDRKSTGQGRGVEFALRLFITKRFELRVK